MGPWRTRDSKREWWWPPWNPRMKWWFHYFSIVSDTKTNCKALCIYTTTSTVLVCNIHLNRNDTGFETFFFQTTTSTKWGREEKTVDQWIGIRCSVCASLYTNSPLMQTNRSGLTFPRYLPTGRRWANTFVVWERGKGRKNYKSASWKILTFISTFLKL